MPKRTPEEQVARRNELQNLRRKPFLKKKPLSEDTRREIKGYIEKYNTFSYRKIANNFDISVYRLKKEFQKELDTAKGIDEYERKLMEKTDK